MELQLQQRIRVMKVLAFGKIAGRFAAYTCQALANSLERSELMTCIT